MSIPRSYVADANLRMEVYRKLAAAEQPREELLAELADRFGRPPAAVETLLEVAALKRVAEALRVQSISAGAGKLTIRLRRDARDRRRPADRLRLVAAGRDLHAHRRADARAAGGHRCGRRGAGHAGGARGVRPAPRLRRVVRDWAAAAALIAALAGCAPSEPLPDPEVIARLGGEPIRNADFEAHLRSILGGEGEALESEALSQLLDQFLTERLLVRSAVDRGGSSRARPRRGRRTRCSPSSPRRRRPNPRSPPSTRAIAPGSRGRSGSSWRRSVPRTGWRPSARGARSWPGAEFGEVARRVSSGPAADRGGRQGVFAREELPPAFAAVVFRLEEGAVSEVVEADASFHLFQVVARHPAAEPTLEEARGEALAALAAERADRALARVVSEARSRYALEVFDRNLPFAYRGTYPRARTHDKP